MSISSTSRFAALSSAGRVRLLRRLVEAGRLDAIPDIVPPRDQSEPVRLSPAQRDLWVYQSLYPGNASLNLCSAYHFDGPVDPADLETALTIVQEHHDVLRTRIHGHRGHGPHDAPDPDDLGVDFPPAGRFTLDRLDLRGASASLQEVLEAFGRRPFDLSRGRLVRGMFVRVDDERSTLVLAVHHIVSDWWSSDVLHAEFTEIYRAVRDRVAPPLSRPAIQYADFADFQRELETAGVFDAQLGFWHDYLPAPPPPPLTVGPLTTTAGDAAFDIVQVPFHIDAATEAAVRAFARERGASVYGVVFTAFAVFAHRLSGEDDLVIGTPVANRSAQGLDRVIGYVMNTVPVRWRIGRDTGFGELLGRFTSEFPGIMANADVPVGRIVGALDPVRVAGRSPLFQWVFMYLPRQQSEQALRELVEPERIHTGGEYDLIGVIQDADDGFEASLDIRTDVYSPEVVRAWADAFGTLLTALIADPDAPAGQAPLSPDTEQDRLPGTVNDTAAELPVEGIADTVVRQAARTPDAIAVESAELTLTYAELIERADGVADLLRRCGVGAERVVAPALGRSVIMVVAVLAVQRIGAACLPIDPDHSADQITSMLRDAAPVLLVVDAATADKVPETGISRLMLTDRHLRPSRERRKGQGQQPQAELHPASAAYIHYASDAAGHPTGVVVGYAGLAGLTMDFVRRFELDHTSRIPQLAAPGDDSCLAELCMAFGAGGTLVIPPANIRAGAELGAFLRDRQATCVLIPPPFLATVPTGDYPKLRTVCTTADGCPPDLVVAWSTGGRRFFTSHRTSGDMVATTVSEPLTGPRRPSSGGIPLDGDDGDDGGDGGDDAPPIGRPITNKRVYVLDAGFRPVPVGVPGELYVAGAGLARGYLNRPGLTAGQFVADPHASGERMYRTGHLVRWRPDGQLRFLGRTDDQIRVRGIRVDPGAIEAVLAAHPAVAHAAVIMRAGRLVGYVVPSAGVGPADVRPDELLTHAAAALPAPMVPNALVVIKELPTTYQGSLDRAALPDPPARRPALPRPPASHREATLCSLLAELLDLPSVGPDDDFFALGGDSIVAIQLVIRARTKGIELTSREVLTGQTPARLAAMARDAAHNVADSSVGRFPAAPNMRWWQTQGGPLEAFTQSMLLPVPAGLDLARISAALRTLLNRHGTLRMRLLRRSDRDWELEIPAPGTVDVVDVVRVDVAAMSDRAQREAARRAADRARLDPESGRMLSAVWFDTGRGGRLLVTAHHLAVDGASWHILRSELAEFLTGAEIHDQYGTSFPRWARWLAEEAVRPDRVATELPWWERELTGEEARLIPQARPGGRRATITVTLPPQLTEPVLSAAPTAFGCGPADVLLTALAEAAVRWRGRGTDVLVAIEGDGRGSPSAEMDVAGTVGWLTTLYPVRLTATGEMFWRPGHRAELDNAIKRTAAHLHAVPQDGLGYGLLRYLNAATAPRLAGLPGPDLWFNYGGRQLDSSGVELLAMTADATPMMYPVELDALTEVRSDGAHLVANWSHAETIAEQDVRTLAGLWFEALTVIAAHVGRAARNLDRGSAGAGLPPVELREL